MQTDFSLFRERLAEACRARNTTETKVCSRIGLGAKRALHLRRQVHDVSLEDLFQLFKDDMDRPEYVAVNPKSTIPALVRPDGSVLTEVPAIAYWLGRTRGRGKLWPKEADGETQAR